MTARVRRTARRLLAGGVLLALAALAAPVRAESPVTRSAEVDGGQGVHRPVQIPAEIPVRRGGDRPASGATPVLWVLIVGVGVAAGVVFVQARRRSGPRGAGAQRGADWRLGRWLGGSGTSGAHLVQSVRLTPRSSVHVLRWDGKDWLLACSEQSVTLLGQRPQPRDAAPAGVPVAAASAEKGTP